AYSIRVPNTANELIFSYVNMRPITEKINGRKVIDVQMSSESLQLGEVVVVGYGTQRKANLTGAVDQVTSEVLENRSLTNLNQGLQGVLPNLNIRLLDGKPNQAPRFNIRGTTSI
ncbi:MAG: TonB-dependent receptor plug domain-containing protein, partial [Chitinophagaceae bacterium]